MGSPVYDKNISASHRPQQHTATRTAATACQLIHLNTSYLCSLFALRSLVPSHRPASPMASTGVNVLRYSALGAGIFYGIYHQAKLSSASKLAAINREYEHKQSLINQAKAEFSKKNAPASAKTASGGIISDPNDSRFDLEAYLNDLDAKTS